MAWSWIEILAGEVDPKSPASGTLFSRIRNNFYYFYERLFTTPYWVPMMLYKVDAQTDVGSANGYNVNIAKDAWGTAYLMHFRVPASTKSIKLKVRHKLGGGTIGDYYLRLSDGTNNGPSSAKFTDTNWHETELTLTPVDIASEHFYLQVYNDDYAMNPSTAFFITFIFVYVDTVE